MKKKFRYIRTLHDKTNLRISEEEVKISTIDIDPLTEMPRLINVFPDKIGMPKPITAKQITDADKIDNTNNVRMFRIDHFEVVLIAHYKED